jgi:hypothetical protein
MFSYGKWLSSLLLSAAIVIFLLSCMGAPQRIAEPESKPMPAADEQVSAPPPVEPVIQPAPPQEPVVTEASNATPQSEAPAFDPTTVTAAVKNATILDVRSFIESLNQIIRDKDYEAWRKNLTNEYIEYYSDTAVLSRFSEYPIMKRNSIKLETLQDYFIYVVYPSRQNDTVDDIEFVGEKLIKAITVSPKGDRNILYMLEKHGNAWKIGIGR